MARTIYAVVNTAQSVGALEWREDQDALPAFDEQDQRYVVTVPDAFDGADGGLITLHLDGLLSGYDLPDGWEVGPIA